jgi:hypothetical protein
MALSIDDTKKLLAKRFLGKGGIHAVGVSRPQQSIRVYVSPGLEQTDVLEELRNLAAPYNVIVVHDERPSITRSE